QPGATVDGEESLAPRAHRVDTAQEALLQPGVEPAMEEGELGGEPGPPALDVEIEVLDRALAPELGDAAVDGHPVAVMQTHGRRVDEAAVADRRDHRHSGQRARQR